MLKLMPVLLSLVFILVCGVLMADAQVSKDVSDLPKVKINAIDGAKMVLIPAGKFLMGTTDKGTSDEQFVEWLNAHPKKKKYWFTREQPQQTVELDAYYMYKNLVTVAQYRKFCKATKRKMPNAPPWKWQDNDPIVRVKWKDAKAYADWAGAVLPTSAQWEKAARGTDGAIYPWGNDWDATKCSNSIDKTCPRKTSPVGSYPAGASPYGCLDMAGNVFEWCSDLYSTENMKTITSTGVTLGPAIWENHVMRGGAWDNEDCPWLYRSARVETNDSLERWNDIGFRCAVLLPGP